MKIEINKKYLSVDTDVGIEELKLDIINNTSWIYLEDWVLAYSTDDNIVFIDKGYLVESMTKAKIGLELYKSEWDDFSENSVPYIGRELLTIMGEPNGIFFWDLMDEVWDTLRDTYDNENQWRAPTISELQAMYNKESDLFVSGFAPNSYWSSTTYANCTDDAWALDFHSGGTCHNDKYDNKYVRCVRVGKGNTLELAPKSKEEMTWEEAKKYAKNLKDVKQEDIVTVKLGGLHYVEVPKFKEFDVRVEINTDLKEFTNIIVEAKDKEEAKQLAIKEWNKSKGKGYHTYTLDEGESSVCTLAVEDWKVEELK